MDNRLKYGALGIVVLFVFAISAVPGTADERRTELPDATAAEGCELSALGDSCVSASYIHGGEDPALDIAATLAGAGGNFTVRIQELPPFSEDYWIETRFTVVIAGGTAIISMQSDTQGPFVPSVGWPVEVVGTSVDGVALPSVTATAA